MVVIKKSNDNKEDVDNAKIVDNDRELIAPSIHSCESGLMMIETMSFLDCINTICEVDEVEVFAYQNNCEYDDACLARH